MSSNTRSPCSACKLLRRKCTPGCIFAPYFPADQAAKFACVHRVFGASNVAKILTDLRPEDRAAAANSLAYEARAHLHDPIYGCVPCIAFLEQKLNQVRQHLDIAKKELVAYLGSPSPSTMLPPSRDGTGTGLGRPEPPLRLHSPYQHPAIMEMDLIKSYEQWQELARFNAGLGHGRMMVPGPQLGTATIHPHGSQRLFLAPTPHGGMMAAGPNYHNTEQQRLGSEEGSSDIRQADLTKGKHRV